MREYLRTRPDWMDRSKCAEIVSSAPAPLERKLSALELIAKLTELGAEKDYHDPGELAKSVRIALNKRSNVLPGTVFYSP